MSVNWSDWLEEVDTTTDVKEFFWKGIKEYSHSVMARDSSHYHWYTHITGHWIAISEEKYTTLLKSICFDEIDFMDLSERLKDDWQVRQVW